MVTDPLSWAFSTHRDACGLALDPVRKRVPDVHRFHRYVSADPTVAVDGTLLPATPARGWGAAGQNWK